jgi:hypothetical protein
MRTGAAEVVYGARALAHWRRWRPRQPAQLPDPQQLFAELRAQVSQQVGKRSTELAGPDPAAESYLVTHGRLQLARHSAPAQTLCELVLLPGDQDDPTANEPTATPPTSTSPPSPLSVSPVLSGPTEVVGGPSPTALTADHPRYRELDGDPGLTRG